MRTLVMMCLFASMAAQAQISSALFRHHYIARELPGTPLGAGASALADFDKDGDLDFSVYNRRDGKLYWFEQTAKDSWTRHLAGEFRISQLGCVPLDVDADGWIDIVVGGYWFRNTGRARTEPFVRYTYDSKIQYEIHDIVIADIDGDGRNDLTVLGDRDGCFWYSIPPKPAQDADWPRTTITLDVLNARVDTHAGIHPAGIGDLDGDGDADVFVTDRWYENAGAGQKWIERRLLFGKRGPWGFSARSWIKDLNGDGANDIVVVDCDGQNSGVAWLENNGRKPPEFRARYLANRAPGTRGSFHSMRLADFDGDGDDDILVVEQEDPYILPLGATPRWFIWENLTVGRDVRFEERVILDQRLGGHDVYVGDIDGDGDLDIASKIWSVWKDNSNGGQVHIDWLENLSKSKPAAPPR
ncbi:MAG: VCBS repeat-containing protein [Bryobacteraceae bacterium]|nr:VCBS repeat-containing protein [Bryobacteraceae bacterium]